jgi:hypothetical protein
LVGEGAEEACAQKAGDAGEEDHAAHEESGGEYGVLLHADRPLRLPRQVPFLPRPKNSHRVTGGFPTCPGHGRAAFRRGR